jgi:DNA topoisomerase-1
MIETQLSHKEFLKIDKDMSQTARVADLIYVSDKDAGISRVKKGTGFAYFYKDDALKDEMHLERIKKLAIPPAWTDVWICLKHNGHIQATGIDARGRKQYRYHTLWHTLRNETKFHRLYEFGKLLPGLRLKLEKDFESKELSEEKVLATAVKLMERTSMRIGNNDYEKLYGSYGLTTLKDKHVKVNGANLSFTFTGKKGITHNVTLTNKKLAKVVKACRDIPGKELFQYIDAEGNRKSIDSGKVNQYIKDCSGGDYTAKDFRTWAGTLNILRAFCSIGEANSDSDCKKNIVAALDAVSEKLGNTRTVCKKYYVHPGIIKMYEEKKLDRYLKQLDQLEEPDGQTGYTDDEKILMKILKELV